MASISASRTDRWNKSASKIVTRMRWAMVVGSIRRTLSESQVRRHFFWSAKLQAHLAGWSRSFLNGKAAMSARQADTFDGTPDEQALHLARQLRGVIGSTELA
jgi:hypothetical protein